jgi:hypothetical protein
MNRPEDVEAFLVEIRSFWPKKTQVLLDYITTLEGENAKLAFEGGLDATTRAEAAEAKVAILQDALDYGLCLYGARDGTWPVHQRKEFTRRANAAMDAPASEIARAALQGGQG